MVDRCVAAVRKAMFAAPTDGRIVAWEEAAVEAVIRELREPTAKMIAAGRDAVKHGENYSDRFEQAKGVFQNMIDRVFE
jgi:hypothetical protein